MWVETTHTFVTKQHKMNLGQIIDTQTWLEIHSTLYVYVKITHKEMTHVACGSRFRQMIDTQETTVSFIVKVFVSI